MVVTSEPCEIRVHHIQFVLAELANIYDGIYAAGNGLDVFLMDKLKIDQETCPICEAPNLDFGLEDCEYNPETSCSLCCSDCWNKEVEE